MLKISYYRFYCLIICSLRKFSKSDTVTLFLLLALKPYYPTGKRNLSHLFNIFSSNIPYSNSTMLVTCEEYTAILASDKYPMKAANALQNHLNEIDLWSSKWKIKINAEKSITIPFTLCKNK